MQQEFCQPQCREAHDPGSQRCTVGRRLGRAEQLAAPTGAAGLLAYSECMRAHGVPDFPDPVGNSLQIKASAGSDLDPNSPQMQAAQKACQSLQPGGGQGGTVRAAQQAQALKFSACMRSNGVPNFPDPTFSGGGV